MKYAAAWVVRITVMIIPCVLMACLWKFVIFAEWCAEKFEAGVDWLSDATIDPDRYK